MKEKVFHIISNAHLDPVWLWDRYEGLTEGVATCMSVLKLMEEFPQLTFTRGETSIYKHMEDFAPDIFSQIKKRVEEGRWEIVGGTYVQADTNLTGTETMIREFEKGKSYFRDKFGVIPHVAWFADSFGHSAGMPEILTQCGMDAFFFWRPQEELIHLSEPAFKWKGCSGAVIDGYRIGVGWYGTGRSETQARLDATLEYAGKSAFSNVGVFAGLGDHGGGPVRRQILDTMEWAERHPEVVVKWSSMNALIEAVREENAAAGGTLMPEFCGELNYTLRGCYASAGAYKALFRRCEALRFSAEAAEVCATASGVAASARDETGGDADDGVLFGAFHDLLPGSAVESAFRNQFDWLHGSAHSYSDRLRKALWKLSSRIDTRRYHEPGLFEPGTLVHLVWNPNPWPVRKCIELESELDARPLDKYKSFDSVPLILRNSDGTRCDFQRMRPEELVNWESPWRMRAAVNVSIPALGWTLLEFGADEGAKKVQDCRAGGDVYGRGGKCPAIGNSRYVVSVRGDCRGIDVYDKKRRKHIFKGGFSLRTVADDAGSWGGSDGIPSFADLQQTTGEWRVTDAAAVARGPVSAVLNVRMECGKSRIDLAVRLNSAEPEIVEISGSLFADERHTRIKMEFPVEAERAVYDVTGGAVERGCEGEVPGGRWADVLTKGKRVLGVASDSHYCFNLGHGRFAVTLARACLYAHGGDGGGDPNVLKWNHPIDSGRMNFKLAFTSDAGVDLPRAACELECPCEAFVVVPSDGNLPRKGSVAALSPASLTALSVRNCGNKILLRIRETSGKSAASAKARIMGRTVSLGRIPAFAVRTFTIDENGTAEAIPSA